MALLGWTLVYRETDPETKLRTVSRLPFESRLQPVRASSCAMISYIRNQSKICRHATYSVFYQNEGYPSLIHTFCLVFGVTVYTSSLTKTFISSISGLAVSLKMLKKQHFTLDTSILELLLLVVRSTFVGTSCLTAQGGVVGNISLSIFCTNQYDALFVTAFSSLGRRRMIDEVFILTFDILDHVLSSMPCSYPLHFTYSSAGSGVPDYSIRELVTGFMFRSHTHNNSAAANVATRDSAVQIYGYYWQAVKAQRRRDRAWTPTSAGKVSSYKSPSMKNQTATECTRI
ncbi:uncharacterized protein MYCFIDRAFT_172103 [Pseudocercospora fijiensis CIRAD86]|uniref:Uncharacterized protein n=1 Tax=Pseudocercospora fijiensis (strain CIRAD86) TaxID=383855 RepID=M3BAJ3_PSEFD|nr:uncharacterized protein MYCFIDRAFT_172103 [Pseudocercospora fijiensis CIRAD86]EME86327.1 hypothetical protein MYCFIDRAFT_172103 [Pseudocercospora fijiensis CIRAD86]